MRTDEQIVPIIEKMLEGTDDTLEATERHLIGIGVDPEGLEQTFGMIAILTDRGMKGNVSFNRTQAKELMVHVMGAFMMGLETGVRLERECPIE